MKFISGSAEMRIIRTVAITVIEYLLICNWIKADSPNIKYSCYLFNNHLINTLYSINEKDRKIR